MREDVMATFRIELTDEEARRVAQRAREAGLAPEELLRQGVAEWLSASSKEFSEAASYVLKKNAELYHRLS